MAKFPDPVIAAMHHAATTVTCLPVQLDDAEWRAAIFYVLPEAIEEEQARTLFPAGQLVSVGLDADLKEPSSATAIVLGVEIQLAAKQLRGEIVFLTGHLDSHFETVEMLSQQSTIDLFIGDKFCTLLHQQTIPLADEHRQVFTELLKEAASRDALIRFRGQYDPDAAFAEIVGTGAYPASDEQRH